MCRQVGKSAMRLLSDMKTENKLLTWAIIRKDIDPFFMPTDAFVCNLCAEG